MDTFELLPSLAQGELAESSAPELVAAVFRSRASGTLAIETPDGTEIRVFFRGGEMCGTGAFAGFRTLAVVLLSSDGVSALDIDSSRMEAAATGKRHGEVLIAKGILTADQVKHALGAQHRQNLAGLLAMAKGRYEWRGFEPPPTWARDVLVDPIGCIVEAFESEEHRARRQKILDWLGSFPARLSVDWPELSGRVVLGPQDRRAAALLALPRRLPEFVAASRLGQARAEAVLVTLLLAGAVEVHPVARAEVSSTPLLKPLRPEPQQEQRSVSVEPKMALETTPEFLPEIMGDAEVAELLSEEEEPEAAARPGSSEIAEKLATEAATEDESQQGGRDLRKKLMMQGMRNLRTAPPPAERAPPAQQASSIPAAPLVLDESLLGPEEKRFVEEVRSRVEQARVPAQTAYARLGVTQASTSEQIKAAYITAAKRFHPDRSSAQGLAALQPELQALFSMLKDAYDLLATSEARTRYDSALKLGKGSSRKEDATLMLKMGEVLLKKRDFEGALLKLRRAVDLEPTGDAIAALAWGLVCDPKQSPAGKEEAASLINRALRAPGISARTYYVAGVLWRTKDPQSAADAFRKALEVEPGHSDASLELRLLESRRKGKSVGGGVLSDLIFGKRKQ